MRETVISPWRDFGVDTTEVFLPELLAGAGYANRAILGKWHAHTTGNSRHQRTAKETYDGISMLSVRKGEKETLNRNFYLGYGAIVDNNWKLVKKDSRNPRMKVEKDVLSNIVSDPAETKNVKEDHPEVFRELQSLRCYRI